MQLRPRFMLVALGNTILVIASIHTVVLLADAAHRADLTHLNLLNILSLPLFFPHLPITTLTFVIGVFIMMGIWAFWYRRASQNADQPHQPAPKSE